jgi:hypothetical protein
MRIEIQQERKHARSIARTLEIGEFAHPDGIEPEIVLPHLGEALDAREEIVPFDAVIGAILIWDIVNLEFV